MKAQTNMVHCVQEGLRDEAFELARDIGIESPTAARGTRDVIIKSCDVVFPRAEELRGAGRRQGAAAWQTGESMLLKSLDDGIELSEPMR